MSDTKLQDREIWEQVEKKMEEKLREQTEELKRYIDGKQAELEDSMEECEGRLSEEIRRKKAE